MKILLRSTKLPVGRGSEAGRPAAIRSQMKVGPRRIGDRAGLPMLREILSTEGTQSAIRSNSDRPYGIMQWMLLGGTGLLRRPAVLYETWTAPTAVRQLAGAEEVSCYHLEFHAVREIE